MKSKIHEFQLKLNKKAMRKTRLTLIITLLITISSLAQQGINYKALIKNTNGDVLASTTVNIEFTIKKGTSQTDVYEEGHTTPTDNNGILIVNIGEGNATLGSFDTIDWGSGDHFLNVKINTGSGFIDMGTSQFMAVPYALSVANVGLEPIDEGNGIGWRLKGRDPDAYLNIGLNAVDLSVGVLSVAPAGASGGNSIAMGVGTSATSESTFASGQFTKAEGFTSTAMGSNTKALGNYSTAIGYATEASGTYSTAMGNNTTASEENSIAMGNLSLASGLNSTAMGHNTTASGANATAMGSNTTASEENSFAMGYLSIASGVNSLATGSNTKASGPISTTMGSYTTASGAYSTAMGYLTTVSGSSSTAMGFNTTASGAYTTAMGNYATALGNSSTAMGNYTRAEAYSNTAVGIYNIGGGTATTYISTNPLFEVGNGTDEANRSNALTVFGGSDATLADSDSGYLMIGNANDLNLVMDRDEIMARNNGTVTTLSLQPEGGAVLVGGLLAHASDFRLKKDIKPLTYGLNEILQLQPKIYSWKNRKQKYKSLGLIAQEVQPIIKEIVTTQNDEEKTLGISYTALIPVLINAIKEQQIIIDNLQSKLENKNSVLSDLITKVNKIEKLLYQKKDVEVANNNN